MLSFMKSTFSLWFYSYVFDFVLQIPLQPLAEAQHDVSIPFVCAGQYTLGNIKSLPQFHIKNYYLIIHNYNLSHNFFPSLPQIRR
jgi:hypothetical protein